jgi:hypothetical protein
MHRMCFWCGARVHPPDSIPGNHRAADIAEEDAAVLLLVGLGRTLARLKHAMLRKEKLSPPGCLLPTHNNILVYSYI